MSKKNKYALTALAFVAVVTTTVAITQSINRDIKPSKAECSHEGRIYHQEAFKATPEGPGEREYWACCECNDAFDFYDEEEHKFGNRIGNTVDERANLEVYDIEWNKTFEEFEYKSLYEIIQECDVVDYSPGELATPIHCGETDSDKVYFQVNEVEGTKTISFYVEEGRKARVNDEDIVGAGLFQNCDKLKGLNVNFLDTSSLTNFSMMFDNCSLLTSLDVSAIDTLHAETFAFMFACDDEDTKLKEISGLHKFHTNGVQDFEQMFKNRNALEKLSIIQFDSSNGNNFSEMFSNCGSLTTIYATDKFVAPEGSESSNMFALCSSLVGGNGTSWSEEHIDGDYAVIDNEEHQGYFSALPEYKELPNYLCIVHDIFQENQPSIGWDRGRQLPEEITIDSHYIKDGYPCDVYLIETSGFENSETLTSVTIGKEFTSIPRKAFSNCSALRDVNYEEDSQIATICEISFCGCPNLQLFPIPDTVTEIKGNPCPNSPEVNFAISEENEYFSTSHDGKALLNKDGTRLISWPSAKDQVDLLIEFERVTEISKYCFFGNKNITEIGSLPEGLKIIGEGAFQNCSNLDYFVDIPETIMNIGAYAFADDISLTNLIFTDADNWYCGDEPAYINNDDPETTANNLTNTLHDWCKTGLAKSITIYLDEEEEGSGCYSSEDESSFFNGSRLIIYTWPTGETYSPSSLFFRTTGEGSSLYKMSLIDNSKDIRILKILNSAEPADELIPGDDYDLTGYDNDQLAFTGEGAAKCAEGFVVYCSITSENVNSLRIELYAAG